MNKKESVKVLMIEDSPGDARLIRELLAEPNETFSDTEVCETLSDGLQALSLKNFDVVLLDLFLPDSLGIESLLKARDVAPSVAIIVLTGLDDEELALKAVREGAQDYLVKGQITAEVLSRALRYAIERKRADRKNADLEARLWQTQKTEAISALAGGIAHQFNNALYVITGNIDLLEFAFPRDERVASYSKAMKDSARRMTQLTAQLLAYAEGGKYQVEIVSVGDFVEKTSSLLKHTMGSGISVDINLPRDILCVKADLTQIQMALSAVLINASEAMEGKGCIRVTCEKEIITGETSEISPEPKPENYACLTITDDGKGMDEGIRKRVFEPFFTTKFEGRGLGMAAAYGIVRSHDGRISVDSEPGRGTTVKICLPAVEAPAKEDERSKAEPIRRRGTVLVIDDEEAVMGVTRAILERLGYNVLEAATGREAIEIAKTFDGDIDLAMLDILLTDMYGNVVYPLLMEVRPNLKVLIFSGYSIDGPAQEILDAGAEDFIQKPFSIAELSEKLDKIFRL
ncbi:response regulator [Desulfobacterales bacterium HSG2]|nr:response regulator [Desulfobacterales bacterium HSG2]